MRFLAQNRTPSKIVHVRIGGGGGGGGGKTEADLVNSCLLFGYSCPPPPCHCTDSIMVQLFRIIHKNMPTSRPLVASAKGHLEEEVEGEKRPLPSGLGAPFFQPGRACASRVRLPFSLVANSH